MTTNQERLEYLAGPQFKADIFTGADVKEVQARSQFFRELFGHAVPLGDTDKFTSLGLYLQWYGSGLHNVYAAILKNQATTDALLEAVKALAGASVPGSAAFDQDAFFARLTETVDASVDRSLEGLSAQINFGTKES
jgi:hypothetical protein